MNVGASLAVLALTLAAWGMIISGAAVVIERAAGPRWLWRACLLFVVLVTGAGTIAFHRSFPGGAGTVTGTLYMLGVLVGLPSAAVAFVSSREGRRPDRSSWGRQLVWSYVAYLMALPPALLLGALPDIVRVF
jgi:hypothetical protein